MSHGKIDNLNRKHIACPYCSIEFALDNNSYRSHQLSFEYPLGGCHDPFSTEPKVDYLYVDYYRCPVCNHTAIIAINKDKNSVIPIQPVSFAKHFPEYIPQEIIADYEEAYAISHLSPKASVILSRRCIESIIKDFWGSDKFKLSAAIESLKSEIPDDLYTVLKSAAKIGNAGAHYKVDSYGIPIDIKPFEANSLLRLIELLFDDWYIKRHNRSMLFEQLNNSAL